MKDEQSGKIMGNDKPNCEKQSSFLRVAIIGMSNHVKANYLDYLITNPGIKPVAICDLALNRSKINELTPDIPFFTSIEELMASMELDAVIISTPHYLHYKQAAFSLDNGFDVFVDKPLALTESEITSLIEKSKIQGKILFTGLPRRYSELNRIIFDYLNREELGKIVDFDFSYYRPFYQGFESSWRNSAQSGGGVLMDAGYHIVDCLLRLAQSSVVSLKCHVETYEFNVEVAVKISAKFSDKSVANISLGLNGPKEFLTERMFIHGTEGALYYNRIRIGTTREQRELLFIKNGTLEEIPYQEKEDLDVKPLIHFFDLCKSRKQHTQDLQIDLKIIQFIREAYKDAEFKR